MFNLILLATKFATKEDVQPGEGLEKTIEDVEEFTQNKGWLYIDWEAVGRKLFTVLLIAVVGVIIIKLIRKLLEVVFKRQGLRRSVYHFLDTAIKFFLGFMLIIFIARELGFQTTSLIAILGSVGLAIGLALQGSLSDLASGIMILVLRPIRYNDLVYLAHNNDLLRVQDIRLFNTSFTNPRGFTIIIPNKKIISDEVINLSKDENIRIQVDFSVSYDANLDQVRKTVEGVLKDTDHIIHDKGYQVAVSELADSSVNLFARAYVLPEDFLKVTFSVREDIKKALDRDGIEIPFPQMDVRLYKEDM